MNLTPPTTMKWGLEIEQEEEEEVGLRFLLSFKKTPTRGLILEKRKGEVDFQLGLRTGEKAKEATVENRKPLEPMIS